MPKMPKTKNVDLRDMIPMCPPYDPTREAFGLKMVDALLRDGEVTVRSEKDGRITINGDDA